MHAMDLKDHNGDADDLRLHFRSRVFGFRISNLGNDNRNIPAGFTT